MIRTALKIFRLLLCAAVTIFVAKTAKADYEWTAFTSSESITGMTISGGHIWCATEGGVVCWNTNDMSYVKYTAADGLGTNEVLSITHGRDGTIYAGTRSGGLSSYDGKSWFTLFEEDNHYYNIFSLLVSPFDDLWAGAAGGNFIGNGSELHLNEQLGDYKKRDALCMACAPDSTMWLGTSGAVIWSKGDVTDIFTSDMRNYYQVVAIACAPDGDVWISSRRMGDFGWTDSFISCFDGKKWTDYTKYDGIENLDVNVNSITVARDSTVWFGCDTGIMSYDGTDFTKYLADGDVVLTSVKAIGIDEHGDVWAGGRGGLVRFDGVRATKYSIVNEPVGNHIYDLDVDNNGVVWTGTYGKGVSSYDGYKWTTYTRENGVGSDYIRAVAVSPVDNEVWVTDDIRISCFNGDVWRSFPIHCDGFENPVTDIAVDRRGVVWISSVSGVYSFSNGEWTDHSAAENVFFKNAECIHVTADGSVLVGVSYIVYRFDGEKWETMVTAGRISDISSDSSGNIWVGQGNLHAVMKYDGIDRTYYLPEKKADTVTVDTNDSVWAGIYRGGLMQYTGGKWIQHVSLPLGERLTEISLAAAPDGSVWMGTYGMGVFRFHEIPVQVDEQSKQPELLSIHGNFPNPFNMSTTIQFTIPKADFIEMSVYNSLGQHVRNLHTGKSSAGYHSIFWDGCDDSGESVASGIYFSRLISGNRMTANRMLLIK